MIQLQNFGFLITSMVVLRGTAAPVLLKWFVSRDVPTGAPSSNGTIIPILIPSFPFLVGIHSRKFIRSMDGAKSGVLVRASRPVLLPDRRERRSSSRNAFFRFVPLIHFLLLSSLHSGTVVRSLEVVGYRVRLPDLSYLESFCGVLCCLFFRTLFYLPRDRSTKRSDEKQRGVVDFTEPSSDSMLSPRSQSSDSPLQQDIMERSRREKQRAKLRSFGRKESHDSTQSYVCASRSDRRTSQLSGFSSQATSKLSWLGAFAFNQATPRWVLGGACLGGVPPSIGLEALALPTSRLLMAVGHDYYQKVNIQIHIEHGGVCILMLGVLLSNTNKIQFTQRLPLGSELHMGKERCCLRGLDHLHGPTSHSICGNLLFYKPSRKNVEHDSKQLRADQLPINFPASYDHGKVSNFLHRNREHQNLWLTMFPEKRYFFSIRERTHTTEVAIHTNPFTDLYAPIGTGSERTGGWYTTIMKLPLIFCIRIGFLLASSGGSRSLLLKLKNYQLHWNREFAFDLARP